jgi:hypothetical protein
MTPPIDHKAGPSPLAWFLAEIDRVPPGQLTGAKVRELLRGMAGCRIVVSAAEIDRRERLIKAAEMLANGVPVGEVRARLPARLGVRRSTAYYIVERALKLRGPAR